MNQWIYGLFWMCISGCLLAQADSNAPPSENEGILQLPKGISVYVTAPDGVEKSIEPKDGRAVLPMGKYKLQYWMYKKTDAEGKIWKLRGYGGPINSFEIDTEPLSLDIKAEPIDVSLNVSYAGDYIFSQSLKGPVGESIYLYCDGKQADPPPVVITNQDKSFSVSLTGKYG